MMYHYFQIKDCFDIPSNPDAPRRIESCENVICLEKDMKQTQNGQAQNRVHKVQEVTDRRMKVQRNALAGAWRAQWS